MISSASEAAHTEVENVFNGKVALMLPLLFVFNGRYVSIRGWAFGVVETSALGLEYER